MVGRWWWGGGGGAVLEAAPNTRQPFVLEAARDCLPMCQCLLEAARGCLPMCHPHVPAPAELLRLVDELVAAVVARVGVALRVLVGHH